MKRHIYGIVLLMASCLALLTTTAHAQDNSPLRVHIPFAFTVGNTTLTSSDYRISWADAQKSCLRLSSADNYAYIRSLTILTVGFQDHTKPKMHLLFKKYGEAYFLSQMQMPDYKLAFFKSRAEVKLRRIARPQRTR